MTDEELSWVAGILEGEGSFSFARITKAGKKTRRKLRIRLSMTDFDIVNRVKMLAAPHARILLDERSTQTFKDGYKRKDTYILTIEGFAAEGVMRAILPYMGHRRAEKIIECLAGWNDRLGPVWTPPTEKDKAEATALLAELGLE